MERLEEFLKEKALLIMAGIVIVWATFAFTIAVAHAAPQKEWRVVGGDSCKADSRCTPARMAAWFGRGENDLWPVHVRNIIAFKMQQGKKEPGMHQVCQGDAFDSVSRGGGKGPPMTDYNVVVVFDGCYDADLYQVQHKSKLYQVKLVSKCGNHATRSAEVVDALKATPTATPYPRGRSSFHCAPTEAAARVVPVVSAEAVASEPDSVELRFVSVSADKSNPAVAKLLAGEAASVDVALRVRDDFRKKEGGLAPASGCYSYGVFVWNLPSSEALPSLEVWRGYKARVHHATAIPHGGRPISDRFGEAERFIPVEICGGESAIPIPKALAAHGVEILICPLFGGSRYPIKKMSRGIVLSPEAMQWHVRAGKHARIALVPE